MSVSVLEDPTELGRRISAARGYAQMQRPAFAKAMGISVPTLRRYEEGEVGSLGRSVEQRRQVAELVLRVSKAPAEILGLPGDIRHEDAQRIAKRLSEIVRREIQEGPGQELEQELADALLQADSTSQRTGEQGRASPNE